MTEVNDRFAEYTTSIAFHLSLSRQMVICMVEVKQTSELIDDKKWGEWLARPNVWKAHGMHSNHVPAFWALHRRGLVYESEKVVAPGISSGFKPARLTAAGEAVFTLLEMAGLVAKIEARIAGAA